MKRIKVSENKRFLMYEDGEPFFWLADTAWELIHTLDEKLAEKYMKIRRSQGFNVIQTVILSEFDGLKVPNAYGHTPLMQSDGVYDPTRPDEEYFAHADRIIKMAEKYGFYVALLPTWGDKWNIKWGKGPEIFNEENAREFGRFVGERYKDYDNIIWIMGGDRPFDEEKHRQIIRAMANGIKQGGATQIMSLHPVGRTSSADIVNDEKWLDFNMIQSGHSEFVSLSDEMISDTYNKEPRHPVVDAECNYEDHPRAFSPKNGFFDATDVRNASYKAVFAGSFGITYGNHSVWSMVWTREMMEQNYKNLGQNYFLMPTPAALVRPGARQMKHIKKLMLSRPFFERVPNDDILAVNFEGALRQVATRGEKYYMIYVPHGLKCTIKRPSGDFSAHWFDPRTGRKTKAIPIIHDDAAAFVPPAAGRENDYVLLIDLA